MISQNEGGDQSATTRSAISAGTINVTNGADQTQDVAGLSRDTANTNGTVAKTPDVNAILSQQADTMQAAQAAGQVVSQGIGAYADMKRDDAAAAYKAASESGDSEGMAAAAADYNNWKEGGDSRAELHIAGGALIGGLGGGSVFSTIGGAAGAGAASKMAGSLNDISKGVASATGSDLIGNLAANIAAGVGGAVVGGTAGAAMASNVQLYNQSVDDERALTGDPGKKSPTLFDMLMMGVRDALGVGLALEGGPPVGPSPSPVSAGGGAAKGAMAGGTTTGYGPGNSTLNSGNDESSSQGANTGGTSSSGEAARLVGQQREETVANLVNGSTSGEQVAVKGLGSTDIDVVAENGDLIAVGGPAKANNLGKLGTELRIYQTIADQRGVSAQVYFAEGTPQSAINLATKILGESNVKIFSGSK
ncbi:hypothetical protein [Paraburkholderia antibiotica]|uniref:Uncharacterized protein n=1 Tax=Paraburkholderia antibiotica TaxID=2728839 RepID=A0A7X9X5H8_9BURK|nr:hypothetical protein [Paraburkholderia antibiotica]NML31347.1 hypothetical protein [Paraburkholderia antibiotica]